MALTDRQQKILDCIECYIDDHSYPPTIREIGESVGISSTSVVNYHLNKLKAMGRLEREGQVSRGLKLPGRPLQSARRVPLLGLIRAGSPLPVLEQGAIDEADEQDLIEVTDDLVPRQQGIYALKVKGTSMIDALINDGDIVIMEHADTADNGDMVAAWIKSSEETTLKRFYSENGSIRLQPMNPTMEPIVRPSDDIEIQGKVVAVIRNLD